MRNTIVVGYGSIGARHARLLRDLDRNVAVVSSRVVDWPDRYKTLEDALAPSVDHVIVANETSQHWQTLLELRKLGYGGKVLLEKPVAERVPSIEEIALAYPPNVWVGYNLRFHPALRALRTRLDGQRAVAVNVHTGQDLRAWRSARTVESTYSAQRSRGGGVLRDLSHELDYVAWLFGTWTRLTAIGGHLGALPIDSDDCWSILFETPRCAALSVQLDYYHRPGMRSIVTNARDCTIHVDLIKHTYMEDDLEKAWSIDRDLTYRLQLEAFVSEGDRAVMCTLEEGLETLRTIEAIEQAAASRSWIER